MEIYFDFIGQGRPELIEKGSAVEKTATNEGCLPSRTIQDGEVDDQNDSDCLNDTYYFSKCMSKSSVSYRHEKASFTSITSITWFLKVVTFLGLLSMVVVVEGFVPLPDDRKCFYGPCSWVNSNLCGVANSAVANSAAGTAARLRERRRVVSVLDDICHSSQKNESFFKSFQQIECCKFIVATRFDDNQTVLVPFYQLVIGNIDTDMSSSFTFISTQDENENEITETSTNSTMIHFIKKREVVKSLEKEVASSLSFSGSVTGGNLLLSVKSYRLLVN